MGEGSLPPPVDMDSVEMLNRDAVLSKPAIQGLAVVTSGTMVH